MKHRRPLVLLALITLVLPGCPLSIDDDDASDDDDIWGDDDDTSSDDDDSAGDDDDSAGDDDDSAGDDDDSAGDDDDSSPPTPACDDVALQTSLSSLSTWSAPIPCSHIMSIGNAADTVRIGVLFQVLSSVTEVVGMTWSLPLDGSTLPDQVPGSLEVQTGTDLTLYDCEDDIDPNLLPVVVQQWDAIAGVATMTVDQLNGKAWTGGPLLFDGTVELSGVVVELSGSPGTTCTLPDISWSGLNLGWLPGG